VVLGGAANKYVTADAIRVQRTLPQVVEAAPGAMVGQTISDADAAPLVAEALRRWSQLDPTAAAQLAALQVRVAPLPAGVLGLAGVTSHEIWLSSDAAGQGWYVDATPQWDEEFAGAGQPVAGLDLLSTVTHELGHLLGYPDLDASLHGLDPMAGALGTGLRRLPGDGWSLETLPSATTLDLNWLPSVFGPTPLASLATLDDLDAEEGTLRPLALGRDALFAELDQADWPAVGGAPVSGAEASGRGRRKDRCEAHEAREEVFADWDGEAEGVTG
jgi:hypothetical protein